MSNCGGTPTPETKAYSERTYKRNVLILSERSQGERRDKRRAYVTHKPVLQTITTSCNHLPFGLCVPFPTCQKLRFHLSYSRTSSLVFDVREPLCV